MGRNEASTADRSAERIAIVSAKYDWQCHQNALSASTPKVHTPDWVESLCELAPTVLRRTAHRRPD